jgi:hypothetical protein
LRGRGIIGQIPDERRRGHQVLRQIRESHLSDVRRINHNLAVDAPDLAAIVRKQGRRDGLKALGVILIPAQHQGNFATDKLVEQLGGI